MPLLFLHFSNLEQVPMRKRRRKKQNGRRRSSKSSNLVAAMMDKMELPKIRDYISMLELIISTVLIK